MKCPRCGLEITLEDLKSHNEEELRSLRGQLSLALRKTPPKPGPGRPKKKVESSHN